MILYEWNFNYENCKTKSIFEFWSEKKGMKAENRIFSGNG